MVRWGGWARRGGAIAGIVLLAACNRTPVEQSYPQSSPGNPHQVEKSDAPARDTLTGPGGGIDILGLGGNRTREAGGGTGVGVRPRSTSRTRS
jgi:hypothetical protein